MVDSSGFEPLRLHRVSKQFSDLAVVQGLSLTLVPGEILTLLGPSGCGKTTTLRLVAGFEHPDSGEVYIQGRRVAGRGVSVPPEERGVGMVFQDYALFPHLTVGENVSFGLLRLPRDARRRKVEQVLRLVGLEKLADRLPGQLSGGQQQRVALARALAPEPAVILLDEPFSNLDAHLRVQMREEVRRILKQLGSSALFVTHDQKDALAISDRMAVMNRGRVEQVGDPRTVYQYPNTRFVAQFVGQTNLLPGSLIEQRQVLTPVGTVPCGQTKGLPPGSKVLVSIRPDSFEIDSHGPLSGAVRRIVYTGNAVEVEVEVPVLNTPPCVSLLPGPVPSLPILIHAHPEMRLVVGDVVRFSPKPDFVAVIEDGAVGPGVTRMVG